MAKILAWSISRWNEYEQCPFKSKLKVIDKLKEPGNEAMNRGLEIHNKIEKYLTTGGRVPKEAAPLSEYYKKLRALKPKVELEIAFTKKWEMCDWFGKDAWCRVKVDALVPPQEDGVARLIDHKSGKIKEHGEYENQLQLYGLAGLLVLPTAEKVQAELAFMDHGKVVKAEEDYLKKDVAKLKKSWEAKVKPMLSDTLFAPRPGNHCRWCHFRKSNNGPCSY